MSSVAVSVYEATCQTNGSRYIGVTARGVKVRSKEHIRDSKKGSPFHFHRAIAKHGAENFSFEVRASLPTMQEAKIAERILVALEQPKYNMTSGGEGTLGLSRPDSVVRGKARKGVPLTSEHRLALKKARNARPAKKHGPETRAKISTSNTGKVRTQETRDKLSTAKVGNQNAKGSVRSPETRAKISATKRFAAAQKKLTAQDAVRKAG